MKLYLDTSVYNRPFDDQSQPRVWLETLAFTVIFQMIESGDVELVSSRVLGFENSRNPFPYRRVWIDYYLSFAKHSQELNKTIKERAQVLEKEGLNPIDALHLACAEVAQADYFLTCDDKIIKRYKAKRVKVMNPVDFVIKGEENAYS